MRGRERSWLGWVGAGLLLGVGGCSDAHDTGHNRPTSEAELRGSKTALLRANSCSDLLTKIQDDAIAKLDLTVALAKERYQAEKDGNFGGDDEGDSLSPISDVPTNSGIGAIGVVVTPTTPQPAGGFIGGVAGGVAGGTGGTTATPGGTVGGGSLAGGSFAGGASTPPSATTPGSSEQGASNSGSPGASSDSDGKEPTGASDTNTQVAGVDEADFVKLVDSGKGMFLLHGNKLLKLKTYPAEQLSLETPELKVEGAPSEFFVTPEGRAVIFSSVSGYEFGGDIGGSAYEDAPIPCSPFGGCGGGFYGGNAVKVTVADVSGSKLTNLRELYYEGAYVSSRRIDNVVRVVLQGQSSHYGLFEPDVDTNDPWGRPYPESEVFDQLQQWRDRVAASVRNTKLTDWVPVAKEAKDGKLVDVDPDCDSFYMPQPGLAEGGIVHVLTLDVSKNDAPVGGVTVMGQASTVYSNADRLVLAQPDYRWLEDGLGDVGFIDEQRTSLHVFGLSGAETKYLASGWVRGHLPNHNPQFGLDVSDEHALRIATTGNVRVNTKLSPKDRGFWEIQTESHVIVLKEDGPELKVVGTSEHLGEEGENAYSARFVGDRAYVVTFRQTDPLYVLDVAGDQPKLLGKIKIPGFAEYMHPLDDNHLITVGESGTRGKQLQLFDVSDPKNLPAPKTLDFGSGSSSEVANDHKAFTFYAPKNLIALPITGSRQQNGVYSYLAALRVIRVDAQAGFELLGSMDHSSFFTNQSSGCFSCGPFGCNYFCGGYGTYGATVRRGHFVENSDTTYAYAISSGGVSVAELDDLENPLAKVTLPAILSEGPWYSDSDAPNIGTRPSSGGGFVGGGSVGTAGSGPVLSTPPGTATALPGTATSAPKPTMPPLSVDPLPPQQPANAGDGGTAMTMTAP